MAGRPRVAIDKPVRGWVLIRVSKWQHARTRAPWAAGLRRVEGGYRAFADARSLQLYDDNSAWQGRRSEV